MAGRPKKRAREREAYLRSLSKAQLNKLAKRRERASRSPEELAEQRRLDTERCYDWERIRPNVEMDRKSGCWIWLGSYKLVGAGRVRPIVRAGQYGQAYADLVVYWLTNGREPPMGTFVYQRCGNVKCVAASHVIYRNDRVVKAQKRGESHEHEAWFFRGQQGRQRCQDAARSDGGTAESREGRRPAARRTG